ncbi:MAG: hypothetical protein ACLURV_00465 [Gallintestinimicrobium sp.]
MLSRAHRQQTCAAWRFCSALKALRADDSGIKEACQGLPTAAQETKILQRVWNFVKKRQRQGMGFYGIRRRKPQIERTAAGGFVAA